VEMGKLSLLRAIGFDYVCVSSGGISPQARPAAAPGYQVPLAAAVKKASGSIVASRTMAGRRAGTQPRGKKQRGGRLEGARLTISGRRAVGAAAA
jgi:hypothetical protein